MMHEHPPAEDQVRPGGGPAGPRRRPDDTRTGGRAYDAERYHAGARERLGIMARRFWEEPTGSRPDRVSGQRWPIEGAFSRHKRVLDWALRARKWANRKKEVLLRAAVPNLMLLAAE